jgi:uncharacterized YccA/Bax inhibitor family protein
MADFFQSTNPTLKESTFERQQAYGIGQTMTTEGTVNKTGILLLCVVATSVFTWRQFRESGDPSTAMPYLLVGLIGGFILALVTIFRKTWAPVSAPAYALFEGLVLGGLSAMFEARFPGIAIQAVGLTIGTLVCMLLAYRSGVVKATENFKLGVFAATGGIAMLYLVTMVLGFFGVGVPAIYGAGPIGIAFSVFVVVIAALNLVLDFDLIEQGAAQGAPKYMEWYGAFALMVTLIWLYMEILRLLSKLRSRR